MSSADEDAAGISASLGDESGERSSGPRTRSPRCRPARVPWTSCPQSGVLEDVGSDTDDIQQELDEAGAPPKWTRSSPRLRPRSARAHRRRPS
jgi:hypothetical protein